MQEAAGVCTCAEEAGTWTRVRTGRGRAGGRGTAGDGGVAGGNGRGGNGDLFVLGVIWYRA